MSKKSLRIIDALEVKNPCPVSQDQLRGNKNGDWCEGCEKQVYDVAKYTPLGLTTLLLVKRGKICVKLQKNEDGRILYKQPKLNKLIKLSLEKYRYIAQSFVALLLLKNSVRADEPLKLPQLRNEETFRTTYGGPQLTRDPIDYWIMYIEGSLGALIMLAFLLLSIYNFIRAFFLMADKSKRRRNFNFAFIFLSLSVVVFLLRCLMYKLVYVD